MEFPFSRLPRFGALISHRIFGSLPELSIDRTGHAKSGCPKDTPVRVFGPRFSTASNAWNRQQSFLSNRRVCNFSFLFVILDAGELNSFGAADCI